MEKGKKTIQGISKKNLGCGIGLLIFIILVIIIATSKPEKNAQNTNQGAAPTVANNGLQIGDEGYLRLPGITDPTQVICLGTTKDDANKIGKALLAKDVIGLLGIPGAFCVGNGSQAKLIDTDVGIRQVRITKGINEVDADKVGLAGWLPYEWVVKN